MRLLIHSEVTRQDIARRLGTADYSYHFVLEAFLPTLANFADVQQVGSEAEADAVWRQCDADAEACLLLSFAPPHRTPWNLRCPVLPVFAWEYPDLPQGWEEQCWHDDERHDWRKVLLRTGAAITLSEHTATALRDALGSGYPVIAVPAPTWERFATLRERGTLPPDRAGVELCVDSAMVDSDLMGLSAEGLVEPGEDDSTPTDPLVDALLPRFPAYVENWLDGQLKADAGAVVRCPIDPEARAPVSSGWEIPPKRRTRTELAGVVYTAVLTPSDGRKNWEDIITAFGWAFRDVPDATLVLKLGGPDQLRHHHQMLMLLSKLSPMRCRVIALHGYLDDADYRQLIGASTYYVNASLCEGLCMPLMEFLCSGVPALAPDHTSMADYIHADCSFIVASSPGLPALWPHGDLQVFRTSRHQIDWHSLMLAYRQSYLLAKRTPARYAEMSAAAIRHMAAYCSTAEVGERLKNFIYARWHEMEMLRHTILTEEFAP